MGKEITLGHIEAERSALGAALLDETALSNLLTSVKAAQIKIPQNRAIFEAIYALHTRDIVPDLVTVVDELETQGKLERAGGSGYIAEMMKTTPSTANHKVYIDIINKSTKPQTGGRSNAEAVTRDDAYMLYKQAIEDGRADSDEPEFAWIVRHFPKLAKVEQVWPEPLNAEHGAFVYPKVNLCDAFWEGKVPAAPERTVLDLRRTILDRYVDQVANKIQFPKSTAFAFAMGSIASAMSRQFTYSLTADTNDKKSPVTLYVIASQPAGTGKSGVYGYLCDPITEAYRELNIGQRAKRAKLISEIEGFKKDLKAATNDSAAEQLRIDIAKKQDLLKRTPVYTYLVDDGTPEGLRDLAAAQDGLINVVSDEADAVNTILGAVYGDKAKKTNHSIFLKAWDGENHTVSRAGKDATETTVKGSVCVLAQDEAIDSVLRAGLSGRGISERVLIMTEKSMLGYIDVRRRMSTIIDGASRATYSNLCQNLVHDTGTNLLLSNEAREVHIEYCQYVQDNMGEGGKYSDPNLRSMLGKAEKQVLKLSAVLHASWQWSGEGNKQREIDDITMRRAIGIFEAFKEFYIAASELHGYSGDAPRIDRVHTYLDGQAQRKRLTVTVTSIRDAIKAHEAFAKAGTSVTNVLKDDILPKMERMRKLVLSDCKSKVYLNPRAFS